MQPAGERFPRPEPAPQQLALRPRDLLQLQRLIDHEDAHDGESHGDLVRDHLRRSPHSSEQRELVVRRPRADHDSVDAQRRHAEDVEDADVEVRRLQVDLAAADDQDISERNDSEGDQRREKGHARGQSVQQPVSLGRDEVFFSEKFDRIGNQGIDQPQAGKAQDRGPVGADAVLDQGAPLSLDPGQKTGQIEHHEEDKDGLGRDDPEVDDHSCFVSLPS